MQKSNFQKIGISLIIVGLADIILMVSSIINKINYSSFLNIFFVIAGIVVLKKKEKSKLFISRAAIFLLGLMICLPIALVITQPFELILIKFNNNISLNVFNIIIWLVFFVYISWILMESEKKSFFKVFVDGKIRFLKYGIIGFVLPLIAGGFLIGVNKSTYGESVKQKISSQFGNSYKYFINEIKFEFKNDEIFIYNTIAIFNDKEIKYVKFFEKKRF